MEVHVLNGDALAEKFPLKDRFIVCRECLIEGPVQADSIEKFWKLRAEFIEGQYQEQADGYNKIVKSEFEKLVNLDPDVVNLWFEHDLFCQVNMWFTLHFIREIKLNTKLNRVMPPIERNESFSGFGRMQHKELMECYERRLELTEDDVRLADNLWNAYQQNNFEKLQLLSNIPRTTFPYLDEVCEAHIQRFAPKIGRPQQKLKTILQSGITNFDNLFLEFQKTESIYGFGDLQVKNMVANLATQ